MLHLISLLRIISSIRVVLKLLLSDFLLVVKVAYVYDIQAGNC
jgi:hypothetical protein